MPWAADYTASSDLSNISSGSLLYQIWYALAEREWIVGWGGSDSLPPAGADIFKATDSEYATWLDTFPPTEGDPADIWSFTVAQQTVDSICTNFVVDTSPGAYDGEASITIYDVSSLRAAAGLNVAGFTRHIPDGFGGYTVGYGYFDVGDYVGPHLYNELKACLRLLTSTFGNIPFWDNSGLTRTGAGTGQLTYAAAKTLAESGYDAAESSSTGSAQAWGRAQQGLGTFLAQNSRIKNKLWTDVLTEHLDASLDFYSIPKGHDPTAPSYQWPLFTWNNNGDWDDADEDVLVLVGQDNYVAEDPTTVTMASFVGNDDSANYPTWPDSPPNDGNLYRLGWWTGDKYAVVHYESSLVYGA